MHITFSHLTLGTQNLNSTIIPTKYCVGHLSVDKNAQLSVTRLFTKTKCGVDKSMSLKSFLFISRQNRHYFNKEMRILSQSSSKTAIRITCFKFSLLVNLTECLQYQYRNSPST